MPDTLKILMVAAEMVPFAKTGGMADVVGALPKALYALGHDVRVVLPRYGRIQPERFQMQLALQAYPVPFQNTTMQASLHMAEVSTAHGHVPVYFVENQHYFDREGIYMYEDDADRFIFFCRACLEGMRQLGWCPDVIHCHDWHTAIIPNWLRTIDRNDPWFHQTATVFTIHNLAYQGVFGHRVLEVADVDAYGFLAHPDTPHLNDVFDFMSRGIHYADLVTTVSETYAAEILSPAHGEGLDPILRDRRDDLFGVLNGIDTELYNAATDPQLAARFSAHDLTGKQACKADLQHAAGLPGSAHIPLLGAVLRLADQKGFDLIDALLESLLKPGALQLIILGTGAPRYHDRLAAMRARYPDRLAFFPTFNTTLTHKIYAGADMLLMPSRVEPCGLTQMIALRYGTVPIVRATGGLADTVSDDDHSGGMGNGFAFVRYEARELASTIERALHCYQDQAVWQALMLRGMAADHSWARSASRYVDLYRRAISRAIGRNGGHS